MRGAVEWGRVGGAVGRQGYIVRQGEAVGWEGQ